MSSILEKNCLSVAAYFGRLVACLFKEEGGGNKNVCDVCACATDEFGIESWVKTSRTCCVEIVGR